MADWYFSRGGQQQGPISDETIRSMLAAGQLGGEEVVWRNGMAAWVPVARVPEFASLLQPGATTNPSLTAAPVAYASPFSTGQTTVLTDRALDMLRKTKPWARFFSILLMIGSGFGFLGGLLMIGVALLGANMRYATQGNDVAEMAIAGVLYIVFAGVYLMPAIYLNRYASRIGQLVLSRREDQLEQALEAQKSFWKFVGVAALLSIVLGLLAMVAGVLIAVIATSQSSRAPTVLPNAPPIPAVPSVPNQP